MPTAALALIPAEETPRPALLVPIDRARTYAANAKASATRRGYASDWRTFETFCARLGLESLPAAPETVALYIAELADSYKPATVGRHLAAIAARHKACGYESPASMRHGAVASVWQGIRRTHGVSQNAKAPILTRGARLRRPSIHQRWSCDYDPPVKD